MKKICTLCILIFSLSIARMGLAQDMPDVQLGEVVVSATKTEEQTTQVTSSVSIITNKEIEREKAKTVGELLRSVVGLDVTRSGGLGKHTSVYLRGGNSGHTLVMIDGVQVNSPTLGSYDFANLTVDNIERIEIVRGPQSTLYGSDAMAGVINIITKKGTGKTKTSLMFEGGSYKTYRQSAAITSGNEKMNLSVTGAYLETDGISAAKEKLGNHEEDGYDNTTISMRLGAQVAPDIKADISLRYIDAQSDLDAAGMDDPNYEQDSKTLILAGNINHYITNWWESVLKIHSTKN